MFQQEDRRTAGIFLQALGESINDRIFFQECLIIIDKAMKVCLQPYALDLTCKSCKHRSSALGLRQEGLPLD